MKRKITAVLLAIALLLGILPGVAMAAVSDYPVLLPDAQTEVVITAAGEVIRYQFTPEHSCKYAFHSVSEEDTYGELYDANGNLMYENDDYYGMNFGIECTLEAGKTYVLAVCFLDTAVVGSFELLTSTGHDIVSVLTKVSDCYEDGLWTHCCNNCDYVWTEVIPAEHRYEDGACTQCGISVELYGTCGDDLAWNYYGATGTLTIVGTGSMYDYNEDAPPWEELQESVTKSVMGDGITYIGINAFSGMQALETVNIPGSVTGIGDSAFSYCTKLREVTLPNGVSTLGMYCFAYCHQLSNISIPATVTEIGLGAFQGCSDLKGIWVEERNASYSSDENGVLLDKTQKTLIQAPAAMNGDYTVPDTVVTIGESAFEGCKRLSALTLPNGLETIGSNAFSGCNSLTFLQIPAGVTLIGETAFNSCSELKGVLFSGDAPETDGAIFENIRGTAYYDAENTTWTKDIRIQCGGEITWTPVTELSILVQPESTVAGNTVTYVVGAYGNDLQYAWWTAPADSENFVKTDETTGVYTLEVTAGNIGQQLYCVVTDATGAQVASERVTVITMPTLVEHERISVSIEHAGDLCYVTFMPNRSCYYSFSSFGNFDTYCELYSANYDLLASNDDGGDQNFNLYTFLEAGKSYIFAVRIYDAGVGNFDIELRPEHEFEKKVTSPTCILEGYTTYRCTLCDYSYRDDTVKAEGHSYTGKVTVKPDCSTPGVKRYTCSICNDTYTEEIPTTDHDCSALVTAPTCTSAGYTTYICFVCGYSYISDIEPAHGHNEVLDPSVAATCTENGLSAGKHCSVCNEVTQPQTLVPATGHAFSNGICFVCGASDSGIQPSVKPTLALKSPTLEFKDMICIVAFYTAENTQDVVEMGMITYDEKVTGWNVETADHVIPGASYDEGSGRYYSSSQGIHAKYLADTVYLAIYAKLKDGSYVYSKLAPYSAITYANSQLKNSSNVALKQLVVAMLNYGAEAQLYFGHNPENLANGALMEEQKLMPEAYRSDMVGSVPGTSAEKQGIFVSNSGFSSRKPAISFEGAFCINYFFTPKYAPENGITLYYWNETDYSAAEILTPANATGKFKLEGSGTGEYRGDITGISAKKLSEAVYVAAAYKNGGTTWTSGVLGYSIGAYCSSQVSKGGSIAALAEATAVYGYHAKQYFGA